MKKIKIAICYDFDKTLSPKNMQAYNFCELIKTTEDKFWERCDNYAFEKEADTILAMMQFMIFCCKEKKIKPTKEFFNDLGKNIKLFDGVIDWFTRINKYADAKGIELQHYIVSSGIKEIIDGSSIAKFFNKIYASSFIYDKNGNAIWPAQAINYTNKTQYLYRINKGTLDVNDEKLNDIMDQDSRPVPFSNMIYIGDSSTDLPSMRLVMKTGGYSIGVYDKQMPIKDYLKDLLKNDKINYIAEADYSDGSTLDKIVKEIIKTIINQNTLKNLTKYQKNKIDNL